MLSMEDLREECRALPGPFKAQAMAMYREATATMAKYPGVHAAERQIKFDLATEVAWLKGSAALAQIDSEEGE